MKIIKVAGFILLGLICLIIAYIAGVIIFNSSYTNFCNLQGSPQRWISQTTDITDNTYRLGGIGNIGIGSTRRQVINAVNRRNTLIRILGDDLPPSRYGFLNEPYNLPDSTLGFYRVRTWNVIEFLFDEDDRVTKIRITPGF